MLGLVGALYMARTLGPQLFGSLQGFKLAHTLSGVFALGSAFGLSILLPKARGESDTQGAKTLVSTAFFSEVVTKTLFAILFVFVGVSYFSTSSWHGLAYVATGVTMVLVPMQGILVRIKSAYEEVGELAAIGILQSVSAFLVIVLGLTFFGPFTYWISIWVGVVLTLPFLGIRRVASFSNVSGKRWKELIYVGFPIYVTGELFGLYRSVDRVFILAFLGVKPLAFYSLANTLLTAAQSVTFGFLATWGIRGARLLAEGKKEQVTLQSDELAGAMGWSVLFLTAAGIPVLYPVVHCVLPQYVEALPLICIVLPTLIFNSISASLGNVIVIFGWQYKFLPFVALHLILAACLNLFAIGHGWGVWGIAGATTLGRLFYCLLNNYLGWRLLSDSPRQALYRVFRLYAPVWWGVPMLVVGYLLAVSLQVGEYGRLWITCSVVVGCSIPGLVGSLKRAAVHHRMQAAWLNFRSRKDLA